MARGTAVGEPVVSQAQTKEFDEGYERVFGNKKPQRGRWVYDPSKGKMVRPGEYAPVREARHAPIMMDRYMEGTFAPDEKRTDIGSRRKRRDYMRARSLADADDFKQTWAKEAETRRKMLEGDFDHKERREVVARALHQRMRP